ncbi:HNH endonuclease [Sulfurimonas sp.]
MDKHGYNCKVCGMSFEKTYGKIGKGFIHIHHIKSLAGIAGKHELNPIKDLVPVCPNCHAMLHAYEPPLSVEELKKILNENKG